MNVQFVASIAPIVRDANEARSFYRDALGLSFEGEEGDYVFTHELEGTKHFGLWPLSEAANACFGTTNGPTTFRSHKPASSSRSLMSPRQRPNSKTRAIGSSTTPERSRGRRSPPGC
jgi:catechol 2,3-dioxygenase-like lactoylglutathione lyase family enzyme